MKILKQKKSIRELLLSVSSGVLLSLPWMGFTGIIMLVAFIPLHVATQYTRQPENRSSSWLLSLICFLTWNTLSVWWIWKATPIGAILAIAINSLLMTIVWSLCLWAKRTIGEKAGTLFLVSAWLSFEYLHYHWELSWPWLTLGNSLANDIFLIQWYEYTGVFGGSLWILATNILTWKLFFGETQNRKTVAFVTSLTISLPILVSLGLFHSYTEKRNPIEVAIIQPNIDPFTEKFSGMPYVEQYQRILSLAGSITDENTQIVVGPETALHQIDEDQLKTAPEIGQFFSFMEKHSSLQAFCIGATTIKHNEKGTPTQGCAHKNISDNIKFFNSSLLIQNNSTISTYHKSKLVAGVEKVPFGRYIHLLNRFSIHLGDDMGTMGQTEEAEIFTTKEVKLGTPICYESAYGSYLAQLVQKGAEIICILTNDGWWKGSYGYNQHFAQSRLRAIETRRGTLQAANTGISGFIDQRGQIISRTKFGETATLKGTLNKNKALTFYTLHGDYIAQVSSVVFAFILAYAMLRKRQKKNRIMPH